MIDFTEFLRSIQSATEWLIAGLAYPVADGDALVFVRFLAVWVIIMALRASGYRHWTVRAGLGILMFFLAIDALLGLAPGRVQVLTVAILGRNVAIGLICFGLAICPSIRPAARKQGEVGKRPRARQAALFSELDKKGEL